MGMTWTMRIFHVTIMSARKHLILQDNMSGPLIYWMSENLSIEPPQIPWAERSWWQGWKKFIGPVTWNFSQWDWFSYCHCWMSKMIVEADIWPPNCTIVVTTWRRSIILDYFLLGGSSNLPLLESTFTLAKRLSSLFTVYTSSRGCCLQTSIVAMWYHTNIAWTQGVAMDSSPQLLLWGLSHRNCQPDRTLE